MRSHKSRIATEGSTPVVVRSSQDTSYRPYRALFRAPLPKTPFLSKLTPVTPWSHCQFFDFASAWITKRSRPLPSSYTVSTPPSFSTRSQTFCASLVQIAVTISPNPSPPRSMIPPSITRTLKFVCFHRIWTTESLGASPCLHRQRLPPLSTGFCGRYSLPPDVVPGDD